MPRGRKTAQCVASKVYLPQQHAVCDAQKLCPILQTYKARKVIAAARLNLPLNSGSDDTERDVTHSYLITIIEKDICFTATGF